MESIGARFNESKSAFRSRASAVTHLDDGMLAGVAIRTTVSWLFGGECSTITAANRQ
jgi:hypothetical protein